MTPYEHFSFFLYLLVPVVPAVILGLLGASARARLIWLTLASLGMAYLILSPLGVLLQAVVFFIWEYALTWGYLKYRQAPSCNNRTVIFYLTVLAGIFPLLMVKFLPLFGLQWSALSLGRQAGQNLALGFLGISYLTFRVIGTMMEIRDGLIKNVNFFDFLNFVFFFPTLASGPIDRYRRFISDLRSPAVGKDYLEYLNEGIHYIFRGLLYKFIIAYLLNKYLISPLTQAYGLAAMLKYMYAYSLYLFFDFAGYSAFAIGVSRFYGLKVPENFKAPFWANNIKDFWNRWHMSLSFWFRDYIYMRFVLDSAKKKRFAGRYSTSAAGYLLLFVIMGVWHGTELHFILYGLYMAFLMIAYEFLERQNKARHFWKNGVMGNYLAKLCTFHFVCFGLLIFSGRLI